MVSAERAHLPLDRRTQFGAAQHFPLFGDGQERTNAELTPAEAELTPAEKDAVSHRGKAPRELAKLVAKVLPPAA
ncbi:hypothetical protein AB0H57_15190 [Micromonospora sp. NPDC050686]|uniref:hypothetical protein n=1 Tax=Micromonospora sp. NPDC050686 TaxID=3154631 RepID=UPI0033F753F2